MFQLEEVDKLVLLNAREERLRKYIRENDETGKFESHTKDSLVMNLDPREHAIPSKVRYNTKQG
jgi:hypothetical protein